MKTTKLLAVAGILYVQYCNAAEGHSLQYANHIFNAVHSAMRQWGSSLYHNGMTAFVAQVPAGTELYHGTNTRFRVNGTEWLAFEPEHALIFAHPGWPPSGTKPGKRPSEPPLFAHASHSFVETLYASQARTRNRIEHEACIPEKPCRSRSSVGLHRSEQSPLLDDNSREDASDDTSPPSTGHGYLHTYRTKHDLRLLYVDGQSAAKSNKGTLDMQDVVILRGQLPYGDDDDWPGNSAPMGEQARADALCKRASDQWHDKIDGVLRMEGGFEIILCSFSKHLDVVSISQVQDRQHRMITADPNILDEEEHAPSMFNYYRAVAARYDGIGGGRVRLDFSHFVSLFAYPESLGFDNTGRPRARNNTAAVEAARNAIDNLASHPQSFDQQIDWQSIADMVVDRYTARIELFTSGKLEDLDAVQHELELAMRPFVDYSERDFLKEAKRCAIQFLPHSIAEQLNPASIMHDVEHDLSLAAAVIKNVTSTICQTLIDASRMTKLEHVIKTLEDLRTWLAWTTWKRCKGCEVDEICMLPIWPVGTAEDFEHPKCRLDARWQREPDSYWAY